MPIRYIIDEGKEILVDDNRTVLKNYEKPFEPKGGGNWKVACYITPDKKISNEFEPGYGLLLLDAAEEWLSYRFENEKCKILEKPLQRHISKPIKEMIREPPKEIDKKDTEPEGPKPGSPKEQNGGT